MLFSLIFREVHKSMFVAVSVGRRLGDFHLIEHKTIYVIKIDISCSPSHVTI